MHDAQLAGARGRTHPTENRPSADSTGGGCRSLPEPETAREWLATMTLIRRFEERAGEMYARAKVGGFLHLSIGEEATIVGSARALLETATTSSRPTARTATRWRAAPRRSR